MFNALSILEKRLPEGKWFKDYERRQIADLIKHFAQNGQKDMAIEAYEKMIRQSPHSEIDFYRALKECFTAEQWETYRLNVFNWKKDSPVALALYYSEENLLDLLEELVFSPTLNIDLFDFTPKKPNTPTKANAKECLGLSHLKTLIKELAHRGEREKVLELYKALFLQSPQVELELYKTFKSFFPKKEWEDFREEIFSWKKGAPQSLACYFKEDRLFDRLAEVVLSPKADMELVDQYAPELPTKYADKVYRKYRDLLDQRAKTARSFEDYESLITLLEGMVVGSKGYKFVHDLATHWLSLYCYRESFCVLLREFLDKLESMEIPQDSEDSESDDTSNGPTPKSSKAKGSSSQKDTPNSQKSKAKGKKSKSSPKS